MQIVKRIKLVLSKEEVLTAILDSTDHLSFQREADDIEWVGMADTVILTFIRSVSDEEETDGNPS